MTLKYGTDKERFFLKNGLHYLDLYCCQWKSYLLLWLQAIIEFRCLKAGSTGPRSGLQRRGESYYWELLIFAVLFHTVRSSADFFLMTAGLQPYLSRPHLKSIGNSSTPPGIPQPESPATSACLSICQALMWTERLKD